MSAFLLNPCGFEYAWPRRKQYEAEDSVRSLYELSKAAERVVVWMDEKRRFVYNKRVVLRQLRVVSNQWERSIGGNMEYKPKHKTIKKKNGNVTRPEEEEKEREYNNNNKREWQQTTSS